MSATVWTAGAGMDENPMAVLPEVLLAGGAVAVLLLGSFLQRGRRGPAVGVAAAVCAGSAAAAAVAAAGVGGGLVGRGTVFGGSYAVDAVTATVRVVVAAGALLVLALTAGRAGRHPRRAEFAVLVLLASVGTVLLAGADDLLLVAAAYLLASVPGYVLAGYRRDGLGTEAALKYYVLGALLGVVMLTGVVVLYGAGGATGYGVLHRALPHAPAALVTAGAVALFGGLLFEAGAVPAHFWVPDVVQGSSAPAAAFLATVPKIGALAALYRFVAVPLSGADGVPWEQAAAVAAAASMTLGNLAAFFQTDVRRLLAYSTVSQVGYLLVPVAVAGGTAAARPALLFYAAAYTVTNVGAFAVVCALPEARTLADYRGLGRRRPGLALGLAVCLLGLTGTPPTAVFLGKLEVFAAAVDGGRTWLAVLAVVNTVASLFYYLRWIAPLVARAAPGGGTGRSAPPRGPVRTVYAAAAVSVLLGVAGGPLLAVLGGPLVP